MLSPKTLHSQEVYVPFNLPPYIKNCETSFNEIGKCVTFLPWKKGFLYSVEVTLFLDKTVVELDTKLLVKIWRSKKEIINKIHSILNNDKMFKYVFTKDRETFEVEESDTNKKGFVFIKNAHSLNELKYLLPNGTIVSPKYYLSMTIQNDGNFPVSGTFKINLNYVRSC